MERLKARSMWEWDEDFPNDEDEIYYYVGQGPEVSNERRVTESSSAVLKDKDPDKEMLQELLKEGGTLGAGALPSIGKVNEDGEKNIHEALSGAEIAKVKKAPTKKKKGEEVVEMGDKTPKEICSERLPDILKASTEARKFSLSLKHLSYSGELVKGLLTFSTEMETVYEAIVKLVEEKSEKHALFQQYVAATDIQLAWWKKAEACSTF